jgi:hypothetical protein
MAEEGPELLGVSVLPFLPLFTLTRGRTFLRIPNSGLTSPEWCQSTSTPAIRHDPILQIHLTYAEQMRVTDGARTRALRSHNPLSSVSRRRHMLHKQLI